MDDLMTSRENDLLTKMEYLRCKLPKEVHEIKATIVYSVIGISDDSMKRVHGLIEKVS